MRLKNLARSGTGEHPFVADPAPRRRGAENIPTVSLCYDKGEGVESGATNVAEIIVELKTGKFANITERAGRAQDKDDGGGLETLRKDGYM